MVVYAPAQIISAPAQLITGPAQPPATGAVVYTALFFFCFFFFFVAVTHEGKVKRRVAWKGIASLAWSYVKRVSVFRVIKRMLKALSRPLFRFNADGNICRSNVSNFGLEDFLFIEDVVMSGTCNSVLMVALIPFVCQTLLTPLIFKTTRGIERHKREKETKVQQLLIL